MAGRRPKPTALHELHGTLNSTRHKKRSTEPQAPGDPLRDPPEWLTDAQKDGWRYAIKFAPLNLLKPIDRAILVIWVEAEDRHRTAAMMQASLDRGNKLPLLTKNKAGEGIVSPYVGIMNRAAIVMLKAVTEMGFSPASRPRLSADAPANPDRPSLDPWTRLKVLQGGKGSGAA